MEPVPCFASYKIMHTTKLGYIDNGRARSQKAESGVGTRRPTATLKFVVSAQLTTSTPGESGFEGTAIVVRFSLFKDKD
jgi:hypothetical protein